MTVDRLLERRYVFVTGKGGVGRTTVAAVLGLIAARRGLRTVVAGVGGRDELPGLLGRSERPAARNAGSVRRESGRSRAVDGEREVSPGLFSIAIDPQRAMDEYLRDQLPVPGFADLLASSRTFGYLSAATPGLRELLTVGKVWELGQPRRRTAGGEPYDMVIVDGPATGYGIGLLAAPRTFSTLARRGPISRQAARIHATIVDPRSTGVVAVCRAEEAAVNETIETRVRLQAELGIELDGAIVNALRGRRFASRDRAILRAALDEDHPPALRRALDLALAEDEHVRLERAQLRRLVQGLGDQPLEIPFVGRRELDREALVGLGELLERAG